MQACNVLVINPNTSASVTALLQAQVQQRMAESAHDLRVRSITARFGPAYISSELGYTIASHATLDAWAAYGALSHAPLQGVMIGCFGDPGLLALREISPLPLTGLAEGAFVMAARQGRFGIVTGGVRWKPMLHRLAQGLGCTTLEAVHTVSLTGAQLLAEPCQAKRILADACLEMSRAHDVQAIVLGGAALVGMAAAIQDEVPVLLIDCVDAATTHLLEQMQAVGKPVASSLARTSSESGVAWQGLSLELQAMLRGRA